MQQVPQIEGRQTKAAVLLVPRRSAQTRFAGLACERCHEKGGLVSLRFDHGKLAKWELTGAHTDLSCRSCHRGAGPKQFERFAGSDCQGCHTHKNAHNGQFKEKKCLDCHNEGGSKLLLAFDHQKDARFALTGFHLELSNAKKCEKCHAKGVYRSNKLECADCHEDSHNGELGRECARCHWTEAHFKELKFDHDRVAAFPLDGEHEKAECKACHPDRKYKMAKTACADCHAEDDPHARKLGDDCARCHEPVKGAPKFDHEKMTEFARTGAHLNAQCYFCHRSTPPVGPQELGWTAGARLDQGAGAHRNARSHLPAARQPVRGLPPRSPRRSLRRAMRDLP